MNIVEIIAMVTFATSILAIVGFVLGNTKSEAAKRQRIYERMDERKAEFDKTFVRKDVCSVINKEMSEDIREMKTDIKKILFEVNGGSHG